MKRFIFIMILILAVGQMYSQTDLEYTNWLIQDKLLAEPWVPVNHSQTEQLLQMKLWDDLYSPDPYTQAVQDYPVVVQPVYTPQVYTITQHAPVGIPAGYCNEAVVEELMWEKIVIISDLKDEVERIRVALHWEWERCRKLKMERDSLRLLLEECRVNK